MAISIEGYKPSLAIKHKDHKGRACPGTFHFTDHVLGHKNALAAFTDRSCSHCDRRETYEMDQLILVAKTDVPINTLTEFCNAIIKEAEIKMKDQPPLEGESKEIKLVSIVKDATNPLRFAAILQIMNPGIDVDAYRFMEELAINAWSRNQQLPMYADTIEAVWRKPIAHNREREVIPYR